MYVPNTDLADANQRVAKARERLELQRELILKLWANRKDTNDAEALFRSLRRTLETAQALQRKFEAEAGKAGRERSD